MRTSVERRQGREASAKIAANHEHVDNLLETEFLVLDIVDNGHSFGIAIAWIPEVCETRNRFTM